MTEVEKVLRGKFKVRSGVVGSTLLETTVLETTVLETTVLETTVLETTVLEFRDPDLPHIQQRL